MKVFWSWQSDTQGNIGRFFVRDALRLAIEELKQPAEIEEPSQREQLQGLHLDHDRLNVPGSPDLASIILQKITESSVFVADVTAIGISDSGEKRLINPNVAIELGFAMGKLGDQRILMVMNDKYGDREKLPFDLRHKAGPIIFTLAPDASKEQIDAEGKKLKEALKNALKAYLKNAPSKEVAVNKNLDDEWFEDEHIKAEEGLSALGFNAYMELRFGLQSPVNKTQKELIEIIRKSEIHTFGWPIGLTLESRNEYAPKPFQDGIRAEVSISGDSASGRESYDRWAFSKNGDFHTLISLFEDMRSENKIFFDTRILRVTEAFLFAANLYKNLGVSPKEKISIRITHSGLSGRQLTAANPSRQSMRSSKSSDEDSSQTELILTLEDIQESLVKNVKDILGPLFMLFAFTEYQDPIYEDLIGKFKSGQITG